MHSITDACTYAGGFPQHYAAASLKQDVNLIVVLPGDRFPQHYAAASLKPSASARSPDKQKSFSAALRCGLIEASAGSAPALRYAAGFPQHYAAASLKPPSFLWGTRRRRRFPQHYAAASLKPVVGVHPLNYVCGFPQHYAAASLKLVGPDHAILRTYQVFRSITLRPH